MKTFMMSRGWRARVAVALALSLCPSPIASLLHAQSAARPAPTTSASAGPVDGGWPRSYTSPAGASVTLYQPQLASWADQRHAVFYAAVLYAPKGSPTPAYGTIKVESDTSVAVEQRLVNFAEYLITETKFPTLPKDQARDLIAEITASVPAEERVIGLDRILANLGKSQIIPKNTDSLKADPPVVFFSKTPAVLVNVDGDPIWSPIAGNDLRYAVNTNWDLFEYGATKTYYLLVSDTWLKATALDGPWVYAGPLPESFFKLPDDENWKHVLGALPGKRIASNAAPKVFVSTTPAELILVSGEPKYVPVAGTQNLLWVRNTPADVFREGRTGLVYFLVSGRWFSAPDFTAPWTFATLHLPEDFKHIPLEHERSRVLASVPGTPEAAEAVLLAQIPQTARVSKDVKAPAVAYQGDPQFQAIPHTTVARAVNTDKDILKVGDLYYMCFQGVWFMSRTATGPWEVTGSVPQAIYQIPVDSPAYSVTYVTVQQSNTDAVVFATAVAFTGLMVAWGCAVWGTGYYYPPYVWHGGMYPVYHPHYPTYGYGAAYNPWTGSYARGAVAYGPYGGAGVGARYNATTGTYSRGAAAWGPYGGAAAGLAYNPRTGTYAQGSVAYGPYGAQGQAHAYNARTGAYGETRQGSSVYGNWGASSVQRGDQWANTAYTTNSLTGATTREARTSQGSAVSRDGAAGHTSVGRNTSGDVYAAHDGNVYKNESGRWQKYDNGGWNSVQQPTQQQRDQARTQVQSRASSAGIGSSTMGQLNADWKARRQGVERTNAFSNWRRSGGGGSFRGGGLRRR